MPNRSTLIYTLACLAALAAGLLIYLPGLPGDFVFDDFSSIVANPAVTAHHDGLAGLLDAMLSAPIGGLLRPLSMLSLILNARLGGLDPFGFKLTNILIHLACGVALWSVAREILHAHARGTGVQPDEPRIRWLSLIAAALWLVHPLNLTAVLYVVQRETSLSALFSALAMLAYLAGRRRGLDGRGGVLLMWIMTPLCVVLGMLCKETAALVPVYLLVIEYVLLDFRGKHGTRDRGVLAFFGLFLALPLLMAIALAAARPGFFFASYLGRDYNAYERLISECRVVLDYLRWTFVPDLHQLGLFHDDVAPSHGLLQPATTLFAVIAVGALIGAAFAWRRRFPWLAFGLLWFFGGQLMESTVLPLELVFEHRNYLPIFGLILACVAGVDGLCEPRGLGRVAAALGGTAFLVLALSTAMRAYDWQSELSFARAESRHHPGSVRAVTELQWAYMRYIVASGDASVVPLAVQVAEQAKALEPGSINQDVGLAYMYAQLKRLPEAQDRLRQAAARIPDAKPTSSLQAALQALIQLAEPRYSHLHPEARAVFEGAFANPRFASQPCYVANAWNTYAIFQEDTGELPAASAAMQKAVDLCPREQTLRSNFARLLLRYHDYKDARVQIDALKADHDYRMSAELLVLEREYARQASGAP
jgi:tetratricopeptide (TPR) repeat protein